MITNIYKFRYAADNASCVLRPECGIFYAKVEKFLRNGVDKFPWKSLHGL